MNGRPNLVYVFADQLRADALGRAGNRHARTANIDSFAAESVDFRNAVSSSPVCAPYRASLFTGKYSSGTGMVINELRMNPNHYCFGHALRDGGYDSAYIGKWHLYANSSDHRDMKNHFVPPGPDRLGFDGYWAAYGFWHRYYEAFYFEDTDRRIDVEGYEPDVQTDLAIRELNRLAKAERPFALFLSYGTVHDPWTTDNVPEAYYDLFKNDRFDLPETWSDEPDPHMDRFRDRGAWIDRFKPELPENLRIYHAMAANLDWNFGRLLQAVDEAGLREDTIVVFTSDHGEMFGAHGRIQKLIFYDEAARVPFFLRMPRAGAGASTDVCLGTPDIMPTLLSLMGLRVPSEVQGSDLSFAVRGQPGPEPQAALLQGMGHTHLWEDGYEWRALRGKRFTYAVYRADGSELLFDNAGDPLQRRNLAGDPAYRERREEMRRLLRRRMDEIGDTFESCTWYRDHWVQDRTILRAAHGPATR